MIVQRSLSFDRRTVPEMLLQSSQRPHGEVAPPSESTALSTTIDRVKFVLAPLVQDLELGIEDIHPESSLVDDLALDSLKFVDLTLALEAAFGIEQFPMQDWIDREAHLHRPFTIEALARACLDAQKST